MEFLMNKRIGLVLRVYAPTPELVSETISQLFETITKADELRIDGLRVFKRIDVMIAADKRYVDSDCGLTFRAVEQLAVCGPVTFNIEEITKGDLFCGLLNAGLYHQIGDAIDYTMYLSHGVLSYLTPGNMRAMLEALEKGALVTGLAINELWEPVIEGRIQNTCSIWHTKSLMQVGAFAIRSGQPRKDDRSSGWLRDGPYGGEDKWSIATGVEEIIPLINLIKVFERPCIAPIVPQDDGDWGRPTDRAVWERDRKKFRTKYYRQVRAAAGEGVSFEFIETGVMPEYRY